MSRAQCLVLVGLVGGAALAVAQAQPAAQPAAPSDVQFQNIATDAGLDFIHDNGAAGLLYLPEIMGPGAALFDFDGDGDLDIFLVQGGPLGAGTASAAVAAAAPAEHRGGRLYRNDLGTGSPRFVDVTARAQIVTAGYGMGVATGDVDGDGWTDLFLANFGADQLWRNRGDGSFEDATASSGLTDDRWSVSASFLDFDRDGRLDLFVANYVDFPLAKNPPCYAPSSRRDYCGPDVFTPVASTLYRNLGGGRFADVSARAGIAQLPGPGLGVIAFDADGDGWDDIYVANDGMQNRLWRNRHDGTFEEVGLPAGVALNREGRPEAGMGVDAGDADGDGDLDLFLTHLTGETNTLYLNLGGGLFEDRTLESGLGLPSLPWTGFGTRFDDADNDGDEDLFVANGAVHLQLDRDPGQSPLCQPPQFFSGRGDGRFAHAIATADSAMQSCGVGRGAAYGDLDNDGRGDILVANNGDRPWLLHNESDAAATNAWLGIVPLDPAGAGESAVQISAQCGSGRAVLRRTHTDGSYASASEPRSRMGFGACADDVRLRLRWPDGSVREWRRAPLRRYLVVSRGDRVVASRRP